MRLLAAEVTREQVFLQLLGAALRKAAVETDKWEDRTDGSTQIEGRPFMCARASVPSSRQGRRRIKQIGARASKTRPDAPSVQCISSCT